MKRDRYISIIKDLLNDQNSFLYKYKDEIFEKTMELFSYVTLMMGQDTLRLVNRIAKMRFEECKSDEEIIEELTDVNKCDVYKTIKYIEEITSDILLSVVTDYLVSEEEQPDIFEVLLVNSGDCDEQEELVEEMRVRKAMKIIDSMQKHYHIDSTNMKHKKENMSPTLFDM